MIRIITFPLAPSANEAYFALGRGQMAPTSQLKAFKRAVEAWAKPRPDVIAALKIALQDFIRLGLMIRVDAYFVFEYSRLFTKEHQPKKLDANNRLKAALDGLTSVLEIDDKYFWSGLAEKVWCDSPDQERTIFVISAVESKGLEHVLHDLGLRHQVSLKPTLVEKVDGRARARKRKAAEKKSRKKVSTD